MSIPRLFCAVNLIRWKNVNKKIAGNFNSRQSSYRENLKDYSSPFANFSFKAASSEMSPNVVFSIGVFTAASSALAFLAAFLASAFSAFCFIFEDAAVGKNDAFGILVEFNHFEVEFLVDLRLRAVFFTRCFGVANPSTP